MAKSSRQNAFDQPVCENCTIQEPLDFDFSFAFQPIVDVEQNCVWSYEALVRGPQGEDSSTVLGKVNRQNRYRFDQACRVKTIQMANQLKLATRLNINFIPNAVYKPENCIRTTLAVAEETGFPIDRIIFEITEGERIQNERHLIDIVTVYKKLGFQVAIDDFGAGYSGLNLLATYQPDIIKLDMALVKEIHINAPRQAIVRGIVSVCREMNIMLIAEGAETAEEYHFLKQVGVRYIQGFYFAEPAFEALEVPARALY